MKERRPRSYLVTPDLDLAKRERLEAFNVWWLQMNAEEFAEQVFEPLADASREGHDFLAATASAGRNRLQEVGELIAEPTARSEFLLGAQPLWSDLQSERAITRLCDQEFFEHVEERIKRSGPRGIFAITGTAGTGKTTSLMALALRLLSGGHQVAWVDDTTDVDARTIVRGMSEANAPRIVGIDGAEEKLGSSFSYLARDLVQLPSNPLVLTSVRSGRADAVLNPYVLRGIQCEERAVPPLADSEIDDLIDALGREQRLGVLRGLSRTDQRRAFQRQAERQLLVAMIQATSGEKFEDKIWDEYRQLSSAGQTIYAIVCLSTQLGYHLNRQEVLQTLAEPANEDLNALQNLADRHLFLERPPRSGRFQARHRLVAERLMDRLRVQGLLAPTIESLGRFAARLPDAGRRHTNASRLRIRITNHTFVYTNLGQFRGQTFYQSIENDLGDDFHFWLQRGSFELEWGDLHSAENYLGQARGLEPGDHRVENEWAYLQFRKANVRPTHEDAPRLVEGATAMLKRLMDDERTSEHPFHVLGSQGLAWSRKGRLGRGERGPYLRELIMHVEGGAKRFPSSSKLRGLLKALKEEYLGIAVTKRRSETGWPGR